MREYMPYLLLAGFCAAAWFYRQGVRLPSFPTQGIGKLISTDGVETAESLFARATAKARQEAFAHMDTDYAAKASEAALAFHQAPFSVTPMAVPPKP